MTIPGGESVLTFETEAEAETTTPFSALASGPVYADHEPEVGNRANARLTVLGTLLALVFFANAAWLWGSFYRLRHRLNNLNIAAADFEGDLVGSALLASIESLNNATTPGPTYTALTNLQATSPKDVQGKVFKGDYWTAIYATQGASARFSAAVATDGTATA
ncbi:hypothetical protein JCM11641_005237 [Rhodosporidiobolus odoratus]